MQSSQEAPGTFLKFPSPARSPPAEPFSSGQPVLQKQDSPNAAAAGRGKSAVSELFSAAPQLLQNAVFRRHAAVETRKYALLQIYSNTESGYCQVVLKKRGKKNLEKRPAPKNVC